MDLPIVAAAPSSRRRKGFILAPFLASVPPPLRELMGLLPVGRVNEATLEAAKQPMEDGAVAGLLLVDPFLRFRDTALALEQAGVSRISNFPTVQLVDGETARAFDSARMGPAREVEMLAAFRDAGFETIAFATTLPVAQSMLRDGASALVLHPGLALADWRERANAGLGLARMMSGLRGQADASIMIYRPHGFGHELDPAIELADGIVQFED